MSATAKAKAKQILLKHLKEHHTAAFERAKGLRTLADLQQWHGKEHHQHWTNHLHAGINRGAGDRPPGWKTGEEVVERA